MIVYLLVFISGFSSLIYEIVWMRALALTYGNTSQAAGMILALFMGGLALGAHFFGRWEIHRPIRTYGLLEGLVGLWGFVATQLLETVRHAYASVSGMPVAEGLVQTAILAALILPPTFMMGASLPLLLRARADFDRRGLVAGLVYGINTVGGFSGALVSGFLLIPLAGLKATITVAVVGNLLVCLVAVMCRESTADRAAESDASSNPETHRILAAFAMCGLSSLALEVFWTRILVLEIGSSVYAYSILLMAFLMGVGLGSFIGGFVADRARVSLRMIVAVIEICLAASVFAQYRLLNGFALRTGTMDIFFTGYFGPFAAQSFALFFNTLQFVILPTAIMGASFPLLLRSSAIHVGTEQKHAGQLYLVNTVGGAVGALSASFLVIPAIGVHKGMFVATIINIAAALLLAFRERRASWVYLGAFLVLVFNAWILMKPSIRLRSYLLNPASGRTLISFAEDQNATVTVEEIVDSRPWRSISVNGVNVAGTSPDLLDIQEMQGHLPLLLADHPRKVLHIGFGSGGTAYAVSRYPVESITVAEISPAVIRQASAYFADVNRGVLNDPRVSVWYGDGRNFLLRSHEMFDVILSDSIHPRYSGNGSLYTEEYYQLCRSRLTEHGLMSQWLPLYTLTPSNFKMILRSFVDVFPSTSVWYVHSTINPFTVVIGKKVAGPPIPLRDLMTAMRLPTVSKHLSERGHGDPLKVLSYFVSGGSHLASFLAQTPPHIDDLPLVEYESGRLTGRNTWVDNFVFIRTIRENVSGSIDWTGIDHRAEFDIFLQTQAGSVGRILDVQLHTLMEAPQ